MKKNIYYLHSLNSKSKNTPKMEKGPSFDEPYVILIRNKEFLHPYFFKILVSKACIIRNSIEINSI